MNVQQVVNAINVLRAALSGYGGGTIMIEDYGNPFNNCSLTRVDMDAPPIISEGTSEELAEELVNMPIKKEAIRCLRAQQS
jgi:hypothetical protein